MSEGNILRPDFSDTVKQAKGISNHLDITSTHAAEIIDMQEHLGLGNYVTGAGAFKVDGDFYNPSNVENERIGKSEQQSDTIADIVHVDFQNDGRSQVSDITREVVKIDGKNDENAGVTLERNGVTYKIGGNGILYLVDESGNLSQQVAIKQNEDGITLYEIEGEQYSIKTQLVKEKDGDYHEVSVLTRYYDEYHGGW